MPKRELKQVLSGDPPQREAHAMLGLCMAHRNAYVEARPRPMPPLGWRPICHFAHYAKAAVLLQRDPHDEAAAAIHEALRLNSFSADYYEMQGPHPLRPAPLARHAGIGRKWARHRSGPCRLLESQGNGADQTRGEMRKPARHWASRFRAIPQRGDHANQGWTYLHQGEPQEKRWNIPRKRCESTRNSIGRGAGMVEALKARHLIYRIHAAVFPLDGDAWAGRFSGGS